MQPLGVSVLCCARLLRVFKFTRYMYTTSATPLALTSPLTYMSPLSVSVLHCAHLHMCVFKFLWYKQVVFCNINHCWC